jgi:hypothetical protein
VYNPYHALPALFTLTYQIEYFNILPLYVVLLLVAPAYLIIGIRNRWYMLLGSAFIYAIARIFDINMPSWPMTGGWYFDPMCWQLMFAIGIFVGLTVKAEPIPYNRPVFWACVVYSFGAMLVTTNVFGTVPGFSDRAGAYLDWDKTDLGLVRITDFMAHAYVICHIPIGRFLKSTPVYEPTTLLGRNSLFAFCVLTLMSILGQILKETWVDSAAFDVLFVITCLIGLYWIVRRLEWQSYTLASR